MDTMFMGQFISSTAVGFITIQVVCVVVVMPFAWDIPRNMIWSQRKFIFFALIVPKIWQPLQNFIVNKFLYGNDFIRHRSLASIFTFWQTFLTFLAGITTALVRFVLAIVGIVFSMPQLFGA